MRSRNAIVWVVIAAVLAALGGRISLGGGGASSSGGLDLSPTQTTSARVVRVVDGDTIHVRAGGREDTVRYIGIDTPESVKPDTPVQCFAKEASHENSRLVDGQAVRLVLDREARDRYGRLLAYVYRASDGLFVNEQLVKLGFAKTLEIRPNTRYANRFSVLQIAAQARGRGMWSRC